MIRLSRLNHEPLVVNLTAIAYLEATPDTAITLTNGDRILVSESVGEVIAKAIAYQHTTYVGEIEIGSSSPLER